MSVKKHYDEHLAYFYEWMTGDFDARQSESEEYFISCGIKPEYDGRAIDLGAGHGIHTISLAKLGFKVDAIDFNSLLLDKLEQRSNDLAINTFKKDFRDFSSIDVNPELIICMGDTLAHLESFTELDDFLINCSRSLHNNGKLVVSFRDYGITLSGQDSFIPVKSDENRILTCILTYHDDKVVVTDQLYEKSDQGWVQKVSSYKKIRLTKQGVKDALARADFKLVDEQIKSGQIYLTLSK